MVAVCGRLPLKAAVAALLLYLLSVPQSKV